MPALRVAVDATSLYGARTGIGRFTSSILEALAGQPSLDLRAFAVTWRGNEDLTSLVPAGVHPVPRRMAAAPLRALWRRTDHPRIERWTGPVDVVHGPNFVVPPSRAATVASVHDLTFLHHPEFCTADVLHYPGLLRRALARGAWIHTDSDFVRNEVIELLGADPERVVTVPLGVSAPPAGRAATGRSLAGSDRYLVALGTIEPRKNLPTLVRAFDLLAAEDADLRLVVAGPDGWGVEAYEAAVAACAHADRVVRVGFVSEEARGSLLAGAAAVAVPSHYEGFGLSAAEAMAAGVPVVASDRGSHPEVVGDAGLLVPADDEHALADALRRVLTDAALDADLRARGPARAARFTWPRTAEGIAALWRRAAGEHTGAH
ncbi:MAG TPA: glycosyltransferase family 1 protein [Acidimicrobiales bacterium]|nr:glycosyltransferase family 1 protein [Acidimicrobiales bacterium]